MIDLTTPMRGPVDMTASDFDGFRGHAYDGATVNAFAAALIADTAVCGLRTSLIAAQIARETGWFRFGGDVRPEQFNLAGLGATGGVAGLSYASIEEGVRAVCAHHMTYEYGTVDRWPEAAKPWQPLDKRYDAVLSTGRAGRIAVIGDFTNGTWAYTASIPVGSLANGYATGIVAIANMLSNGKVTPVGNLDFLIDIRDQLPTASGSNRGPLATGVTPRRGVIIHYSAVNYPNDRAMLDILKSEAQYHVDKGWGAGGGAPYGDGLMYHISVDPQSGDAYLCRDLDAILWHCGYWGDGGNDSGYAVHVPGGDQLVMTDAGLAGLARVVEALRAEAGFSREMVKGHQEVSSTSCPGPLMDQFVRPYRAGAINPVPAPTPAPVPAPDEPYIPDGNPYNDGRPYDNRLGYGGGHKALVLATEESRRMDVYGWPMTNEYDGYLCTPVGGGRFRIAQCVIQETERQRIVTEGGATRIPLRSEIVGVADDPAVDAILKNPNTHADR